MAGFDRRRANANRPDFRHASEPRQATFRPQLGAARGVDRRPASQSRDPYRRWTADGAGVEADLSFSAQLMDELGTRWRAVPGNHDFGDPRHAHQPVNAERLGAWQRHFGPDRWVEDIAEGAQHWRLV